eukprot:13303926-Ditylum_brightwellii.AAC.1
MITEQNWQLVGQAFDSSCQACSFDPIFHHYQKSAGHKMFQDNISAAYTASYSCPITAAYNDCIFGVAIDIH